MDIAHCKKLTTYFSCDIIFASLLPQIFSLDFFVIIHFLYMYTLYYNPSDEMLMKIFFTSLLSCRYSIICLFRIAVGPDEKFGLDRVRITEGFMFRLRDGRETYMPYFSGAILGLSGIFSGTNDIFLGQILQNSGTLSGTFFKCKISEEKKILETPHYSCFL